MWMGLPMRLAGCAHGLEQEAWREAVTEKWDAGQEPAPGTTRMDLEKRMVSERSSRRRWHII